MGKLQAYGNEVQPTIRADCINCDANDLIGLGWLIPRRFSLFALSLIRPCVHAVVDGGAARSAVTGAALGGPSVPASLSAEAH